MKLNFCVACGVKKNLHHHHLIPRSRGGSDEESNLITLCQRHHASLHQTRWNGSLSKLIKAGLLKAKKEGRRTHGTPEEMKRLHSIQRNQYLEYCKKLLPYIKPNVTQKEQARIFQKKGIKRFRNYAGTTGVWDDHGVVKVIRCLVRNNLYKKELTMPKVGKKSFPYTMAGKMAAKKAAKKSGKKVVMKKGKGKKGY